MEITVAFSTTKCTIPVFFECLLIEKTIKKKNCTNISNKKYPKMAAATANTYINA